jgi:Helix-turn-helix domain of resolvase
MWVLPRPCRSRIAGTSSAASLSDWKRSCCTNDPRWGRPLHPEREPGRPLLLGSLDDDGVSSSSVRLGRPYGSIEGPAQKRHERLVERWKEIRRLHLAGASVKDIAEWVGTSQSTVYGYRELAEPPPRPRYRRRASVLDPYLPYSSRDGTRAVAAPRGSTPRSASGAPHTTSTR